MDAGRDVGASQALRLWESMSRQGVKVHELSEVLGLSVGELVNRAYICNSCFTQRDISLIRLRLGLSKTQTERIFGQAAGEG